MNLFKQLSPKVLLFFAVAVAVFSLLMWRLADLQLINGRSYLTMADANRLFTARVPVERGVFLDRYGDPLVYNQPRYYRLTDPEALFSDKAEISREEALIVMASGSESVGYELEREFVFPAATAHVLGYASAVTADELKQDTTLHIEDKTGKMGMERVFDEVLRGVAGASFYEVNALGKKQRKVGDREGIPGLNIDTTLDPYLSQIAFAAMGAKRGAVVILDSATGEVLTLVSTPTYDPQALSTKYLDPELEKQRRQQVSDFFTHPQKLFFNRAISGVYPPGSVFKILTALAGLDSGAIDAGKTVDDTGVLEIGEYSYANWYYTQYGRIDGPIALVRALARSNDIYFYKAAEWTGPQKIADMARLFGLGQPTGIELSGEAAGLVPDPAWKERELGERWYLGNTFHFGIGQDNLLVTPLQVAQYVQTIAKRGTQCSPHLVKTNPLEVDDGLASHCSELGVAEENLALVLQGMLDACSFGGTGFPFFPHNQRFRQEGLSLVEQLNEGAVACKTGTSEFGGADSRGYRQTHGWFTAIVGIKKEDILPAGGEDFQSGNWDDEAHSFRERWLSRVDEAGFPDNLVMVALVESDEISPYREGSADAAPVIKEIVDWIYGTNIRAETLSEEEIREAGLAE